MDLIHWDVFYLIANTIDLLASIYFVFIISPYISIYCIVAIPFIVLITKKLSKKNKKTEKIMVEQRALLNSHQFEFLNGILDIKILSMSYNAIKHLVKIIIRMYREKIRLDKWLIVSERVMSGINLLSTMLIYLFSLFLIMKGHITIGGFVVCTNYISRITRIFSTINQYLTSIRVHSISIDRINEILDMESERNIIDGHNNNTLRNISINDVCVEFENVSFSYDADNPILKELSFKIHYGEKIALVGESGAGKSTIINLICGLYEIDNGNIKFNKYNIETINLNILRSNIGVVHQDIQLFNDTIRYNLGFGNPDLNDNDLWEALEAAHLKQFVFSLPDQLDTLIGFSGTTLSGGQKQRLAIARIFIKNPKLLIFDEATSSLDSEAEYAIQSSWERLSANRTVIIIAHRYSTIKNADKVMVIKNGNLVAFDGHEQLLKHCDYYRYLFQNQYSIYDAEDVGNVVI
jgi:ATP-binding cassette subfamily B protein